jgi:hypothetical protein
MRGLAKSGAVETPLFVRAGIYVGVLAAACLGIGITGILSNSPSGDAFTFIVSCAAFLIGLLLLIGFLSGTWGRWRRSKEE